MDPLLLIDGYKLDHRRQYPDKTEFVGTNFTPRSSRVAGVDEVIFFGLQYYLQRYAIRMWHAKFFDKKINKIVEGYKRRVDRYLGPNDIGTSHIRDLHSLGYLPLQFKALPEGTPTPIRVPMFVVQNTHSDFGWLPNYLETSLSNILWMPCTSATIAKHMRKLLLDRAKQSGAPEFAVDFQGHDFSMRGMSGIEAALLSGAGHLLSFKGTDTIPAIPFIEKYYPTGMFIGGSVPATEHSVMCAGGETNELETIRRLLHLYPKGILSVVSDTWDFWNVLTNILPQLKDEIMAREGVLVIRPDSGDPVKIVCGDPSAAHGSPEFKGAARLLYEVFGGTTNELGFKVLDKHIGLIYGDGINRDRADQITARLMDNGFVSTSVVFGMGSYGYQYQTRDTFGFAMKATWCQIDGKEYSIFKKPKTDDGTKNSAKGRLAVLRDERGKLYRIDDATPLQESKSELREVWRNGVFMKKWTFDEVRDRVNAA